MMKVTNSTFGMLHRGARDTVLVQRQLKSGAWGRTYETARYGSETDEQVVARLVSLNPGRQFRLAEEARV